MRFMLLYYINKNYYPRMLMHLYICDLLEYIHVLQPHLKLLPLPAPCGTLPSGLSQGAGLLSCRRLLCFEIQASSAGCPACLGDGAPGAGELFSLSLASGSVLLWKLGHELMFTFICLLVSGITDHWQGPPQPVPGLNPIFMAQKSGEFNGEIGIISVFFKGPYECFIIISSNFQ